MPCGLKAMEWAVLFCTNIDCFMFLSLSEIKTSTFRHRHDFQYEGKPVEKVYISDTNQ